MLSDSFTVYLPDMRNHGQSPHSDIHDYQAMRDDVFELAMELKLKRFFLAGHSMGGKIAISFAMKWPEMMNGLLIADVSPFANEKSQHSGYNQYSTILRTILGIDLSHISSRSELESILREKISSEKNRGLILKNLERTDGNNYKWKINASSLLKNLDKIMEGIDRGAVFTNEITGFPVIFLKGENSDYIPEEDYKDILKVFPAAEFVIVPGAGHWVHADNPGEVVKNLKKLI